MRFIAVNLFTVTRPDGLQRILCESFCLCLACNKGGVAAGVETRGEVLDTREDLQDFILLPC